MTDTDLTGKVVYVSGPVTTTDTEYAEARTWLRQHGTAHVTTVNRLVDDSLDDDQKLRERIHELTKRDYDAKDGGLVRRPWYDLVVLLDGWNTSRESDVECSTALACGIAVIELAELRFMAVVEMGELRGDGR